MNCDRPQLDVSPLSPLIVVLPYITRLSPLYTVPLPRAQLRGTHFDRGCGGSAYFRGLDFHQSRACPVPDGVTNHSHTLVPPLSFQHLTNPSSRLPAPSHLSFHTLTNRSADNSLVFTSIQNARVPPLPLLGGARACSQPFASCGWHPEVQTEHRRVVQSRSPARG